MRFAGSAAEQVALARLAPAIGRRHGIFSQPTLLRATAHDPAGVFHASVADEYGLVRSAGGGVGTSPAGAAVAAIAEALERYVAASGDLHTMPADTPGSRFELAEFLRFVPAGSELDGEWRSDDSMVRARTLPDGDDVLVPTPLVGLTHQSWSTSSGLAADWSLPTAILRANQELVERDALMSIWLHQLAGRRVDHGHGTLFDQLNAATNRLSGRLTAIDATAAWSRHPVAIVTGTAPVAGHPRHSLGAACRATWADAVGKAALECLQGIVFAGYHLSRNPELSGLTPEQVSDFDRHAVFYTARPDRWEGLPIHTPHPASGPPPPDASLVGDASSELVDLAGGLADAGVRLAWVELHSSDVDQLGLRVARVVSPDLTPIHHHHLRPYIGGTTPDVERRYPEAVRMGGFPSPHPHPLG